MSIAVVLAVFPSYCPCHHCAALFVLSASNCVSRYPLPCAPRTIITLCLHINKIIRTLAWSSFLQLMSSSCCTFVMSTSNRMSSCLLPCAPSTIITLCLYLNTIYLRTRLGFLFTCAAVNCTTQSVHRVIAYTWIWGPDGLHISAQTGNEQYHGRCTVFRLKKTRWVQLLKWETVTIRSTC